MTATPAVHRRLRVAAAFTSLGVLATSTVGYAAVQRYSGQVSLVDAGTAGGALSDGQPMNMLVVASDDRAGLSRAEKNSLHLGHQDYGSHTDTMMLVHLSGDGTHITAVSLPRDTLVTIPDWTDKAGKHHAASKSKLNAAYSVGGPKLMVQTVEGATGVTVDHYAEINFAGFLRMVDALGGVEVCLAKATTDKNSGLNLSAGRQTVSGAQALAYVRARYIDPSADIGRMKRQQKFVGAMAKKALSGSTLTNPAKLDGFLSALASSIKTDNGLGPNQMVDLVDRFKAINPSSIAMTTVPIAGDKHVAGLGDVLLWDQKRAYTIFHSMASDQPIGGRPSPAPSAAVTVAPSSISLQVLNGTTKTGLATTAADALTGAGFVLAAPPANAPIAVGANTVIKYDPRFSESIKTVEAALPGSTTVPVQGFGRTFEVTVGSGFTGVSPVHLAAASKAPTSSSAPAPVHTRTAADDLCG
jgi:LCP family protein required for cell wall assembly